MRRTVSSRWSAVASTPLGRSVPIRALAAVTGVALVVALAACTTSDPRPDSISPSPSPSSSSDTASSTATDAPVAALVLQPQASATKNQAYFDLIASAVTAIDGRSYVDALTAAGFDKAQMEVTFDRTETGLAADTIQFAVRFNGECLLGQNGPASGGYHSAVTAPLASGTCLVGTTRSIDW